jgi:hypothetical protein
MVEVGGVVGGLALAVGAARAIAGAGAALGFVLAGVFAALAASGLWLAVATRKALATRRLRPGSGREALSGRTGAVRTGDGGQGSSTVPCGWLGAAARRRRGGGSGRWRYGGRRARERPDRGGQAGRAMGADSSRSSTSTRSPGGSAKAAEVIESNPVTIKLRHLQTLTEISSNQTRAGAQRRAPVALSGPSQRPVVAWRLQRQADAEEAPR